MSDEETGFAFVRRVISSNGRLRYGNYEGWKIREGLAALDELEAELGSCRAVLTQHEEALRKIADGAQSKPPQLIARAALEAR